MSKRREQPADEVDESVVETTETEPTVIVVKPELELSARELLRQVNESTEPTPFDSYPDDLKQIAVSEYQTALNTGMKQGDAEAAARRTARKWAREHNRRMPE